MDRQKGMLFKARDLKNFFCFEGFWEARMGSRAQFGTGGVLSVCGVVCVNVACHGVANDMSNDLFLRYVFERDDVKPAWSPNVERHYLALRA